MRSAPPPDARPSSPGSGARAAEHRHALSVLDAVLTAARSLLRCELTVFNRVGPDSVLTARTAGALPGLSPGVLAPRTDTLCHLMLQGAPQVSDDVPVDAAYASAPAVPALGLHTYVGVPVRDPEGAVVGTLCGFDRTRVPQRADAPSVLAGLAAVLTPYAGLLAEVDVALVRDDGRWVVEGVPRDSSGTALAALLAPEPLSPPAAEREWLLGSVEALDRALTERVAVEQAVGVLAERSRSQGAAAFGVLQDEARAADEELVRTARRVVAEAAART